MKTPENLAKRYNSGKLQWSLVHYPSLEPMVKVLEFGAEKYDRHNWKKGLEVTKICESMLRHIYAFLDGENNDPESNISHIGHIQANAMFLAYMVDKHPNLDDRGVKEVVNCVTCSNDKLRVNLMGGHYVGNIESEESKSIIDSKV